MTAIAYVCEVVEKKDLRKNLEQETGFVVPGTHRSVEFTYHFVKAAL